MAAKENQSDDNQFKVGLAKISVEDRAALHFFKNSEAFRLFHRILSAYQNMAMYELMKPNVDLNETLRQKGILVGLERAKNVLSMAVDPQQADKK